ncbi:hypothetical protein C8R45DRAFT_1078447 [Mycena sanguinolenta]|nr:hypothetical protein C8R45DRAFT_1078447 [Mycena sanguinolenta]
MGSYSYIIAILARMAWVVLAALYHPLNSRSHELKTPGYFDYHGPHGTCTPRAIAPLFRRVPPLVALAHTVERTLLKVEPAYGNDSEVGAHGEWWNSTRSRLGCTWMVPLSLSTYNPSLIFSHRFEAPIGVLFGLHPLTHAHLASTISQSDFEMLICLHPLSNLFAEDDTSEHYWIGFIASQRLRNEAAGADPTPLHVCSMPWWYNYSVRNAHESSTRLGCCIIDTRKFFGSPARHRFGFVVFASCSARSHLVCIASLT